jgi:membrane protease YdiL (CAAX protease family)
MLATVKRAAQSNVLKVFVYLTATLVLAALLAPLLFNFGKALALVAESGEAGRLVRWLGEGARTTDFAGFFDRALLLSGLLLVFPLIQWLRASQREDHPDEVQQRAPRASEYAPRPRLADQALRRDPRGPLNLAAGFLLGASVLLLLGLILTKSGAFAWRQEIAWGEVLRAVLPATFFFAVVGELLFRGLLLGMFLRALKPAVAVGLLSLLFAFVHFLQPQAGMVVPAAEERWAGFVMLGRILGQLAGPELLLTKFATLVAVGVALSYARIRSGALWLPIGLHAGWVFGILLFQRVAEQSAAAQTLWTGGSLREGLMPLLLILATALLVHLLTIDYSKPGTEADE